MNFDVNKNKMRKKNNKKQRMNRDRDSHLFSG